jgi:outer membrane protein OmpA-like peptidoglycan-associated protein
MSMAAVFAFAAAPPEQTTSKVPLREGLMVVTAIHEPGKGDFESIKLVDALTDERLHLTYHSEPRRGAKIKSARGVLREDLKSARKYRNFFRSSEDKTYPGWTALGPSRAVLDDLLRTGEAQFTMQVRGGSERDALTGTLKRVGPVKFPVLVNGNRVELDAIEAEGVFGNYKAEFYFLDDPVQPLTLHYRTYGTYPPELQARLDGLMKKAGQDLSKLSEHRLDVVKIEYPPANMGSGPGEPVENLEQKLKESGRADVYGIYFDFGSAAIKPESEPVIREIATLLARNAGWKLSIEGHTDNIGGDAYNLDLSTQRAAAVKTVLAKQLSGAADRLTTAGYGPSRPKEANDTPAGRARNRRVELVRQ